MDCFFCGGKTFNIEGIVCCVSCAKIYDEDYYKIEEDKRDGKES